MAISDYSTTAASNVLISGIDISGTTGKVKDGDNAIRQMMADIKAGVPYLSGTSYLIESTDAGAAVGPVFELYRNSATPANADILGKVLFNGEDSAGNTQEYASIETVIVDVTSTSEDGQLDFYVTKAGTRTKFASMTATATAFTAAAAYSFDAAVTPSANDAAALGASGTAWADLFLASGAVINIAAANWVATHTSGILTVGTGDLRVTTAGTNTASVATVGGTQTLTSKTLTSPVLNTPTVGTSILPTANDGAALGASGTAFSDLFLASGAVINADAGNAVITHSSGVWTVSTGDLRVTTAGTNAASVVTVGGTQTLTGKTLTSPVLTAPTLGVAAATSININGGGAVSALTTGTYTPTLTNTTNVAASTAYECRWFRIGDQVIVFGKADVDPTASAASTVLGISLPVASNLGDTGDLSGTAAAIATAGEAAAIIGDSGNDRAVMQWITQTTANHSMNFSFGYKVI
jgi:hypothetical protein